MDKDGSGEVDEHELSKAMGKSLVQLFQGPPAGGPPQGPPSDGEHSGPSDGEHSGPDGPTPADIMDECDTNENGGISKKEAKACIAAHVPEEHQEEAEAMVDEMWPQVDTDNSGEVDEHELSEAMRGPPKGGKGPKDGPPPAKALAQLLKKGKGKKGPSAKDVMDDCDTDNSGGITKEEAHACIDEHLSGSDAEEAHDAVDEGFAEADKDGSGELEMKELRAAMRKHRKQQKALAQLKEGPSAADIIDTCDANKDGEMTKKEAHDCVDANVPKKH
jgi:Ca2+-binding EF-hand superfamily protein